MCYLLNQLMSKRHTTYDIRLVIYSLLALAHMFV